MGKFEDDGQDKWSSPVVPASTVHYFGGLQRHRLTAGLIFSGGSKMQLAWTARELGWRQRVIYMPMYLSLQRNGCGHPSSLEVVGVPGGGRWRLAGV